MVFVITVPQSETSIAIYRTAHTQREAFQTACGLIQSGHKNVAISRDGKRVEKRELEEACQRRELSSHAFV